jgi:hypothetical protein
MNHDEIKAVIFKVGKLLGIIPTETFETFADYPTILVVDCVCM